VFVYLGTGIYEERAEVEDQIIKEGWNRVSQV